MGVREYLPMPEAQGFDPPLLAQRQRDEEPELDQLRDREVPVKLRPQRVVRDLRVPEDRARVGESGLFALREPAGVREVQELIVFRFREALPSILDGPLHASVLSLDGLGNIDATDWLCAIGHDVRRKGAERWFEFFAMVETRRFELPTS